MRGHDMEAGDGEAGKGCVVRCLGLGWGRAEAGAQDIPGDRGRSGGCYSHRRWGGGQDWVTGHLILEEEEAIGLGLTLVQDCHRGVRI